MNLKDINAVIKTVKAKHEELKVVKLEHRELERQYRELKLLAERKRNEARAKQLEICNECTHPLSVMYYYEGVDYNFFNRRCVCCGLGFLDSGDYLRVETLLHGNESTNLCNLIRGRLSELYEINPNLSLEESRSIIAQELPEIEKTIVESRKSR